MGLINSLYDKHLKCFFTKIGIHSVVKKIYRYINHKFLTENKKWKVFHIIRYYKYSLLYDNPPNPMKIIRVDPQEITLYNGCFSTKRGLGCIKSGPWDKESIHIENHWHYRGLKQRYIENKNWEETDYFQHAAEKFGQAQKKWGYDSLEAFKNERCNYTDKLYHDMKINGYQQTAETHFPSDDYRNQNFVDKLDPIICIGRNGEMMLNDGMHRLAIAQFLDLDEIPVIVLVRHKEWQRIRDEVCNASSPTEMSNIIREHINHPDITRS